MTYKDNKGFTLIELLVVIAIIGILASVVLASLSTARGRGKDAAIKASLSSAISQAEIDANGQAYSCANLTAAGTVLNNISKNVVTNGGVAVGCTLTPATNIAFTASLPGEGGTWCVDNNGFSGKITGTASVDGKCQ